MSDFERSRISLMYGVISFGHFFIKFSKVDKHASAISLSMSMLYSLLSFDAKFLRIGNIIVRKFDILLPTDLDICPKH